MATPFPRRRDCLPRRRSLLALLALLSVLPWTPSALGAGSPPVNTARPAISGSARYEQTLTGTQGVWTGAQPMTFTYQWRRRRRRREQLRRHSFSHSAHIHARCR